MGVGYNTPHPKIYHPVGMNALVMVNPGMLGERGGSRRMGDSAISSPDDGSEDHQVMCRTTYRVRASIYVGARLSARLHGLSGVVTLPILLEN
jgi:hypothetical protein